MSFFRDLYTKMAPNDSIRKDSFVEDNLYSADLEEYMEEDGFVVYKTKTTSTTAHQTSGATLEYDYLQMSSTASSFPSGSLQNSNHHYGSCTNNTTKVIQHEPSTFLTASDIPMKLARHLEFISKLKTPSSSYHSKPDIGQFYYDFHLEKKTIELHYNDFR